MEGILHQSKTSYSTMRVTLHYLSLIRPLLQGNVPNAERADGATARVLTCGRRMFLVALGLAWKYLIDGGRSASFWSEISGLEVEEININERIFLAAIGWNLYIPQWEVERWKHDF